MEPDLLLLGVMLTGVTLYALLGGADFGGGVWEFNTALRAPEKERALIYRAIGPVWEANHVWLIFVLVGLFAGFPSAFAAICRALWVPLLLALTGIVFRGVGFAFRSYAADSVREKALWGAVFAFASTAAPFFLGAAAGAILHGRLDVTSDGGFEGDYLTGWVSSLSVFSAFFGVGICAYLAAAFMTREARLAGDVSLIKVWRLRAMASGLWMGVLSALGIGLIAADVPHLWEGFKTRAWPLIGGSAVAGSFSLWALWRSRFTGAALGAAATVASVVVGAGVALYPDLVPPAISIESARAPREVLWALVACVIAGVGVLTPSMILLFRLFKGKKPEDA
ncbi:MAG TPA: cytochrome d ubiquinol oxidase subunit II [Planctomycetota bacterium]|nr:cytochrome d ubiquinol oxidase subunit II [Planctomycetota bacterium]